MTTRSSIQQRSSPITGGGWYGSSYVDPSVIPPPSAIGRTVAGVNVNVRSVVSLGTVFACLRILSDNLASLTPHVYRQTPVGKANVEVDPPEIITDPYGEGMGGGMTARSGIVQMVTSLGLWGNLYRQVIDLDEDGNPSQVLILDPGMVDVKQSNGTLLYQYGAAGKFLDPKTIAHTRYLELGSSGVGLNPIEIGAGVFGSALASEEYGQRFFAQGVSPSGILSISKPLEPNDGTRYQKEMSTNHGGLANAHVPIILDVDAKWQQISVNPEVAQLLESREFSKAEIGNWFGVPLAFLNDNSDRGSTEIKSIEELLIAFVIQGLKGFAARLDEADTLLLPPGYIVQRDPTEIYDANSQMKSMFLQALRVATIGTPNELRALINWPRIENDPRADSIFAPLNSSPVDWEWAQPAGGEIPGAPPPGTSGQLPTAAPPQTIGPGLPSEGDD